MSSITTEVTIENLKASLLCHIQSMTGHSPADWLFNWRIKSLLDLPRPDLKSKIYEKQRAFKARHDKKAVSRDFQEGEELQELFGKR